MLGVRNNLGFGGGIAGVTGGNLGQFGNLGGQFGLQGGDQSQLLMRLIFETVAKGEWANLPNTTPMPGMDADDTPQLTAKQLNSLGYYPPARAADRPRHEPVPLGRVDQAQEAGRHGGGPGRRAANRIVVGGLATPVRPNAPASGQPAEERPVAANPPKKGPNRSSPPTGRR